MKKNISILSILFSLGAIVAFLTMPYATTFGPSASYLEHLEFLGEMRVQLASVDSFRLFGLIAIMIITLTINIIALTVSLIMRKGLKNISIILPIIATISFAFSFAIDKEAEIGVYTTAALLILLIILGFNNRGKQYKDMLPTSQMSDEDKQKRAKRIKIASIVILGAGCLGIVLLSLNSAGVNFTPPEPVFTREMHKELGSPTEIKLREGVMEIGFTAFDNANITSIELPSTLKVIGKAAFMGSTLPEINIPEF